jgi:protocatechuate 3,4-dioxygenase beta subunit
MKPIVFALTVIMLFGALLCVQAQSLPPEATASISGRVTLDGKPAHKIKVTLVPGPYGSPETPGRQSVMTDDEGRYEFKNLSAGRYGIVAASYIYVSKEEGLKPQPLKVCTVNTNEKLEGQDFTLVRGGVLTGRVTDADGKPLILERLRLTYVDAGGKKQPFRPFGNEEMFSTDDRGVYRIFGLLPGSYTVSAGQDAGEGTQDKRVLYRRMYYPGTNNEAQATLIEVKEADEVTGIDLRLGAPEKVFTASGHVTDAITGQPVPDAVIDFMLVDKRTGKPHPQSIGTSLNERAEFQFKGLMPAEYGVQVTAHAEKNYYGEPVTFEIKDKNIENLDVKMQRGATISGIAVLEGVANPAEILRTARLRLVPNYLETHSQATLRYGMALVPADGNFRLSGLVPGKLWLEVMGENNRFYLLRLEIKGVPVREAIEIKTGEQITGVRAILAQATGALRGRVNVVGGALPEGAVLAVMVRNQNGNEQQQRTVGLDSSNGFLVHGLPAGDYEIVVTLKTSWADATIIGAPVRQPVTIKNGTTAEAIVNFPARR